MFAYLYKVITSPAYLLIFSILAVLALFYPTATKMLDSWRDDSSSHGLLLFIVCVYIFYKAWRSRQARINFSFSITGYIVLFLLSLGWWFANVTLVQYVEMVILPMVVLGVLITLLGWRQSQIFWFPVLLMLLAGPLLSLFIPLLQNITATMAGVLLELTGFSAIVEGVLISVPAGTFEVDTGCSGLNVVTVGAILTMLYAYIQQFRLKESVVLVSLGIAVSIFANIIRVYTIILVGIATDMRHPLMKDHGNLGWIIFLLIFLGFLLLVHRFWPMRMERTKSSDQASPGDTAVSRRRADGKSFVLLGLALIAAGTGPVLYAWQAGSGEHLAIAGHTQYSELGTWQVRDNGAVSWAPVYNAGKGDFLLNQTFADSTGREIYFYKRYFSQQKLGNEAINETNYVYSRNSWIRVWEKNLSPANNTGLNEVEETLIRDRDNQEMLVWRWYYTNGRKTGNSYKAKLYNLFGTLTGKPQITVYIVAGKVRNTYDETRKSLIDFIQAANPAIYP